MQADVERLGFSVIEAVELWKLHERNRPAVRHVIAQLCARADHLFSGDAVNLISERTNEVDAASRDDVGFEVVLTQIREQLELWPIDALFVQSTVFGMRGRGKPFARELVKRLVCHARVGHENKFKQCLSAKPKERAVIMFQHCLERLALPQRRILARAFLHPVKEKKELHLERLLAAESAIVIERGNALWRWHEIRSSLRCHAPYKAEDGGFRCAVDPGREWLIVDH